MKSIILAGGSGTRLWPLSRSTHPKQFIRLQKMERTIFQLVYQRCLGFSNPDEIYVVSNAHHAELIYRQIEDLGYPVNYGRILLEPRPKNTLPAIMYAVKKLQSEGDDIVGIFPSDHLINDVDHFTELVHKAVPLASDYIVTYGITPTGPETAYGYIKPGKQLERGFLVDQFKEKPTAEVAETYLTEGYLWNSGMFMFSSRLFSEETRKHAPDVYEAFSNGDVDSWFEHTPSISIDYGILEKSDKLAVYPMDVDWNDLGSYTAFYKEYEEYTDEHGNVVLNDDLIIDSSGNLVYSDSRKTTALIGVNDLVIVDQDDTLLICSAREAQQVKKAVDLIKAAGNSRADIPFVTSSPWGDACSISPPNQEPLDLLRIKRDQKCTYTSGKHERMLFVREGAAAVSSALGSQIIGQGGSLVLESGREYVFAHNSGEELKLVIV
jgi:mannose-1-phosphate guanylyltransferase/mannose-6-phosphate isomerase